MQTLIGSTEKHWPDAGRMQWWPVTWRMLGSPRFYCLLGVLAIPCVLLAGVPMTPDAQRVALAAFTLGILVI